MTATTQSTLNRLLRVLIRKAARSGQVERMDLRGGARLAVAVAAGVITLTIARKAKPVGDRELITFKAQFQIPAAALRYPAEGQALKTDDASDAWYTVTFRWGDDA